MRHGGARRPLPGAGHAAGCGAICPAFGRGCYGCFGPVARPNVAALTAQLRLLGMTQGELDRVFATFNAGSGPWRDAARGPGKQAQERVGQPVAGHADARVHGDDAVRADDHRVEVELGDLGKVIGEP